MTIEELTALHRVEILKITGDKTYVGEGEPDKRADQLSIALRHTICCWVLTEATEHELLNIAASPEVKSLL